MTTKQESLVTEQVQETFQTEQESQEILFDPKNRDRGSSVNAQGGRVNVAPSGYADELRKGRKNRMPMEDFPGRPSSITLYNYEGRPSEVPIAYDPGGSNPSISRYLRKKHCNACGLNGFITRFCVNKECGSNEIIQLYYMSYDLAPQKIDFYGLIACLCSPKGEMPGGCLREGVERNGVLNGFLTIQQMLMHAVSKHPREYGIWQTTRTMTGGIDVAALEASIIARLREELLQEAANKEPVLVTAPEKAAVYVSDKDRIATETGVIVTKPKSRRKTRKKNNKT